MDRMAKFSKAETRRMYSWWWDSHISPKNSKWLQENLTDMDSKVKLMIKLIEEDADSFARRAEMYYKKRPELMKLVEEFYRAYRALAERYDHATGVIRHAHRTMADAFPNQVPAMFGDDSPVGSATGNDNTRSPDSSISNGEFTDESESAARRKAFARFRDEFIPVDHARRSLNFDEMEEKQENSHGNGNKIMNDHDSEEIMALKEAIVKLEAEKEAGLSQYQQSLDKLNQTEAEMAKFKDEFGVLSDHVKKAESEIIVLNKKLSEVEAEKKSNLQNYQQSVEKISKLQEEARNLDERADSAESEALSLKSALEKLKVEKDAALNQYMQSLDAISKLENKLQLTEEDSKMLKERAEKAESEIEVLRETVTKLTQEKEAAPHKYQQCLDTISAFAAKLKIAQDEAKQLIIEITSREAKLKGAEERFSALEKSNQSLHVELEGLMLKMGTQSHELSEKQKEIGTLWACVQEERLRFAEAEMAIQNLQHLHAQTQEELRIMASDLQHRAQILKATETEKKTLQDEVLEVKKENKHLEELNASFESSMKDMKSEILSLVESKGKLEDEIELRLDQRNALQQEIYCLKENLNDLNKKHLGILDQVHAVGLNVESLESSVKDLKNDNARLQENWEKESNEKSALLLKLVILDQLLEKNSLLETSLSDLNAELEAARGKIENLEQSLQSLLNEKSSILDEKDTLVVQLEETKRDFKKISQDNTVLERSLSDAQNQLEVLLSKSKALEDSYQLLVNEKVGLKSDNDGLALQLETVRGKLENLGKLYGELEKRWVDLEKEKESNLHKVEELQLSLEMERKEHSKYVYACQTRFTGLETEMGHWQGECKRREGELDQAMERTIANELEILVLRVTGQELKERNQALGIENSKLLDESFLLGRKIPELEENYLKQHNEIKALIDENRGLRAGNHQLRKALDVTEDLWTDGKGEKDQVYVNLLLSRIQNMKESLNKGDEEKYEANIRIFVLLTWIRQLIHFNEELRSEWREEKCCKESQLRQIEDLSLKLKDVQASLENLQREKSELYTEKCSLTDRILQSEERNNALEEENAALFVEALDLENISLIFRNFAGEGVSMMQKLMADITNFGDENTSVMGKLSLAEGRLEEVEVENLHHREKLQKMDEEAKDFALLKNQLSDEIESGKKMLQQAERELQLAEEKLLLVENEKLESHIQVEDLSVLYNEVKMSHEAKENQILKLSADTCSLRIENDCFHEVNRSLEVELRNLMTDLKNLRDENTSLVGKLRLAEGRLEEFETENLHNKEKLQKMDEEIEMEKKMLRQLTLELQLAQDKLILVAKEKFESNKQMEDLRVLYNEAKMSRDAKENQILKLSTDTCGLRIENDLLHDEINDLQRGASTLLSQLQYVMVSQLLYEQKWYELHEACLGYVDQNEDLKNELAAFAPEIESLKQCILSLEGHTNLHKKKLQDPKEEKLEDVNVAKDPSKISRKGGLFDLRDIRARLQAAVKAVGEINDHMTQERDDLHSKLGSSKQQLEMLQNEVENRRFKRPKSEITEADDALLTKDIVLDQVSNSNGSSHRRSNRHMDDENQVLKLWETSNPDVSSAVKREKGSGLGFDSFTEEELKLHSKKSPDPVQEVNKGKILQRLDSDVQKLVNLQATVQDLKRKVDVTEKHKRGKAVIVCEALKGQLEEADSAILKLFDVNDSLMKNIDTKSSFDIKSFASFDFEGEDGGGRRRKLSLQACRMSEKIGRLQLEVQRLQLDLLKVMDDEKGGKSKSSLRRRILLRDYLYERGRRTGKKAPFCACLRPSTAED